jgi:CPA2 family monovalent cation:H+ antiporter-2
METQSLLLQVFIYLSAGILVVPLAGRMGLGSVLGYLVAGVLIGPGIANFVGGDSEQVMHFAEFGVVMMLFLVGLELEPERLWKMRGPIFALGGAQVVVTAVVVAAFSAATGKPLPQAIAYGLILAMSSTAIALQSLAERGLMRTDAGQKSFAVLLFQDIAVIPILAVFPLLATLPIDHHGGGGHAADPSYFETLPGPLRGLAVLLAIVAVIASGRFLVRPLLRIVAGTGLRELFTAASLLLIVGVTLLMTLVGLSPALGAFLGGVVLANSEYRHELESDIEPFKGLLLGLFFMAVGTSLDLGLVAAQPLQVAGWVVVIVVAKAAILYGLARAFGSTRDQALVFALTLAQIGEFAFVLLSFATQSGILPDDSAKLMVAITALSMAVSPFLTAAGDRFVLPRMRAHKVEERESDVVDDHPPVLVAGCGRFGQICARFLRLNGFGVTVLEVDGEQVDIMRKFGAPAYYGDASRVDLLRAAGAERAKLLVIAVDNHDKAVEIAHAARKHFPQLAILARARGRSEAYELIELELEGVYRETFDTALRVGVDALRMLGMHGHRAHRAARTFRRADEAYLKAMAQHRNDEGTLVMSARERVRILEQILANDVGAKGHGDPGWDAEPLRQATQSAAEPDAVELER